MNLIPPGHYRHFKGNRYEVVGTAKHSESLEEMVVYRALDGDGALWVRPRVMWDEIVELDGYSECGSVSLFLHPDFCNCCRYLCFTRKIGE